MRPGPVKTSLTGKLDPFSLVCWEKLGGPSAPAAVTTPAITGAAKWTRLIGVARSPRSQYDVLLDLARRPEGLPDPVAAVAGTGTGFHGNRDRVWHAVAGNLHLSVAVPVDLAAGACGPAIPALAAVAVVDALEKTCGPKLDVRLKWVNDLLLHDRKIGGVLAATQTRGDRLVSLVLGIGVNVAAAPAVPPTVFVPRVGCLHDDPLGRTVTAGTLLPVLLAALWRRIHQLADEGTEPVVTDYRRACGDLGREVRIWPEGLADAADADELPPPLVSGRVREIGPDLSLHVDGHFEPITGGRLAHFPTPTTVSEVEKS